MGISGVYAYALAHTLAEEGGYSNHPLDKGGATMRGITQHRYDTYRQDRAQGVQDVSLIAENELADIYQNYWTEINADSLDPSLAVVAFDCSVNHGSARANAWLMEGYSTPGSLTARRLLHYADLSNWGAFGRGWTRRAARILAAAEAV